MIDDNIAEFKRIDALPLGSAYRNTEQCKLLGIKEDSLDNFFPWTAYRAALDGDNFNACLGLGKTMKDGVTVLHYAAYAGQTETAFAIIKRRVYADEPFSPRKWLIDAKNDDGATPLHIAAWYGQVATAFLLIKAEADLQARTNDGQTPLDVAIEAHGRSSVMAFVLK